MDGYLAFQYFMAVKLHFTQASFDVFKNPKIKYSSAAFNKRRDRGLFEKLARKHKDDSELIQYYVANFAYGNSNVVYNEEEASSCYFEWIKRKESISRVLENDIDSIILFAQKNKLSKTDVLDFTFGTPPVIMNLYLGNHIAIESLRIIDDYLNMVYNWKNTDFTTSLWNNDILRIDKLKKFVKYDNNRIQPIIDSFNEELDEL